MRIAVDMDDTVVDFFPHIHECVNREYGTTLDVADVHDWDKNPIKELRIFANGGTWWDWLQTRDWLWTTAPAIPGAIGGLRQLRDRGHHVELLTSKPEWAEWVVWAWLGKWRPAVHAVTIVVPGESKAVASGAELLIDDGLHNVEPWLRSGRPAIVFDQPWNQTPHWPTPPPRAHNWAEVAKLVGEM